MLFFKKRKTELRSKAQKEEEKKTEEIKEKENWLKIEGKLTIDLYETDSDIVIESAIAGVKTEDLDINIENDLLEIRGTREKPDDGKTKKNYFFQECYWGPFSRKIILPKEVDNSRVQASIKEGILIIKIPKLEREKRRKIKLKTK